MLCYVILSLFQLLKLNDDDDDDYYYYCLNVMKININKCLYTTSAQYSHSYQVQTSLELIVCCAPWSQAILCFLQSGR